MQRFGTASVPTHAIGLALLKSDWNKAIDLILQKRYGEHPDVAAARNAWLEEKDLDKALRLLPRRVVAERCILESFKKMKGDTRNAMGALSTVGSVSSLNTSETDGFSRFLVICALCIFMRTNRTSGTQLCLSASRCLEPTCLSLAI